MGKRHLLFLVCGLISHLTSFSQKTITTYNKDSTVSITRDDRIDQLILRQKDINTLHHGGTGYRIQIYFGALRQKASEIKADFTNKHADVPAYLTYNAPNFKVRVGDFRTRLEAQKFMKNLEGQYPTIFIVPDEIKVH